MPTIFIILEKKEINKDKESNSYKKKMECIIMQGNTQVVGSVTVIFMSF